MPLNIAPVLLLAIVCSAANAQVFRCTDPETKKVTYSDAPCLDGKQIERKRSAEEQALDAEQAASARQRFQADQESAAIRQQQAASRPQNLTPAPSGISRECEIAQKNAWGANKAQKQREADIICYGPEKAAQIRVAKEANKPIATTCVHNGRVSSCVSR